MDRRRAAGALLALAACIACSTAAPMTSNQTALDLYDGASEGCYYNFQHYGEGDRIMTNEPCLNCTCHNRMLMCYLRVCPFTKPIGQDCTVEKRADQCCPIVTCPDVPVDLLTSTSTSSPAEYGATGVGKQDKYGCSINGRYFPEGSKVPSTPNKPCEHCYCIRNMTTCVMQECTLHVDGCIPIYHKDVCCPVRYSCDHPEDEILLLDDMTTTVRPTPGFLLTTTTAPVTQVSQDCVHDNEIFADGALIKTEKACQHCYCMKGDIVCVVQECGTPMENEGKNCTSLPPRHGQCCPDTYICEGDELTTDQPKDVAEEVFKISSTAPPRRGGVEGSGYRNEPDEPYTDMPTTDILEIEGSGEDQSVLPIDDIETPGKQTPDLADEMFLTTVKIPESKPFTSTAEPGIDQTLVPKITKKNEESVTEHSTLHEITVATESNKFDRTTEEGVPVDSETRDMETTHVTLLQDEKVTQDLSATTLSTSDYSYSSLSDSLTSREDQSLVTTEPTSTKENDVSTPAEVTTQKRFDEVTTESEHYGEKEIFKVDTEILTDTTVKPKDDDRKPGSTDNVPETFQSKQTTTDSSLDVSTTVDSNKNVKESPSKHEISSTTVTDFAETTSRSPIENEIDEDVSPSHSSGRIPGEGDCLLSGITYRNNTTVPRTNKCHTSCKCISSIVKCDPIICSPPPEYANSMNNCQPIYDSAESCCPTYICDHSKETILSESHSQMSGTEDPKPIYANECSGNECAETEENQPLSHIQSKPCTSENCVNVPEEKQPLVPDCGIGGCGDEGFDSTIPLKHPEDCSDGKCALPPKKDLPCNEDTGCQVTVVKPCEGEDCVVQTEIIAKEERLLCQIQGNCKDKETPVTEDKIEKNCSTESCRRKGSSDIAVKLPSTCIGVQCEYSPNTEKTLQESTTDIPLITDEKTITNDRDIATTRIFEYSTIKPTEELISILEQNTETYDTSSKKIDIEMQELTTKYLDTVPDVTDFSITKELETLTSKQPETERVTGEYRPSIEVSTTSPDTLSEKDYLTTSFHNLLTEPTIAEENSESVQENILEKDKEEAMEPQISSTEADITTFPELEEKHTTAPPKYLVTSTQQTTLFDYKKGTSRDEILEISTPAIDEHKYSTGPYITESVVNKEDDREYFDTHLSTASNILYYDGEQSTETLVSKADDTSSILLNEFAMKLPESHKYDDKTTNGDTTFETTDRTNQYIETTDMSEEFIDVKTQDKTSTQESTVGISSNEEEPITENTIEENKLSQDKLPLEFTLEDKMPQTTEYAFVESQKIDSVTPEIEENETTKLTESIITGENTFSTKETDLEESYTKLPVMENTYASEISKTTEPDLMKSLNGRATELPEVDIEEKLQTGAPQLHETNLHTTDEVVSGYDETQTELFKPYTTESTMYTSQTAFVEGTETKMPEYNETNTTKIVTVTPTLVKTEPSKTDNVISELNKGVTENFESVPTVDTSEKTTTEKIESLDHNLSDKYADGEKTTETIDEITLRQELPSTMQFEGNAGIQSTESIIDSHKYTTQVSHILQTEEILPSSFEKEHEYHESERSTTGLYPEVEVKTETYTNVETTAKSEEQGTKEEYYTVTPTESFNEKITTQKQYLPSFTPTILPSFEHILHTSVPEQKVTESVALPVTEDILVESLPFENEQDLTTKLTVSEEDKVTKKPHSVELIDEPEFTTKDYDLSGIEEIEKATIVPVSDDSYSQDVVTSNIRLTSIEEKYDKTTAIPDITITEESHTDYLNMVTDKTSILPDLEDKKTVTNIPETFTTSVFVTERETPIDNLSITTARDQEEMTSEDPEKIYNVPSHTETPVMVTKIDNLNLQDIGKTTDFATLIIPTTNQTKEIQTNKITGIPDKEETIKMTETPDLNILEQLQTVKSEHTTVKAPEIGILIEENTIKIEETGVTEEYTTELSENVTASKDNVQATDVPEKIATALLEYVTEKAFPTPQVEYTEKISDTPERTYTGEISTELPDIFTATEGLIVNTQKVVTIPELVQVTSEPSNIDDNLELTNAPPQKVTVKPSEDLLESEIEKASKVPELEDQLALTEIPLQKATDRPISWALQTGTEQLITKQVFTDTPQVVTENIKQSEDSDVSPMGAPTLTDTTHSKFPDYVKGVTKFADQDKTTEMPEKSILDIHGTNQMESATVINDLKEAIKTTDASEFLIPVEASSFLPDTSSDNKLVTAVIEDKYTEQSTKLSVITTNKPSETVDNEANRITTVIPELVITEKTVDLLEDGLVKATESSIAKDTENYNPVTDSESTNIPEKTDVDKLATEVPDLHTTRISESETYGDAKPEISTQVPGLYSTLKHEPGETASETGVLESTKVSSGTIDNTDTYILQQYTTETPEQTFTKLHKPSTKIPESLVTEHEWSNTEKSITATYSPEIHSSTTKQPEQEFTDEVHESSVTIPEIPITVKAESETQLPLHVSTEIQSTLSPDESHVTDDLMDVTKTPGTHQYTTVLHDLTTEALHEETINKEITQTELPVSVDTSPEVIHNIPDETKMPVTKVTTPDISDVTEKLEASTQPNIEVSVEIDTGSNEIESTPINETSELLEYSKPTSKPKDEFSESTPYFVELEEHTHKSIEELTPEVYHDIEISTPKSEQDGIDQENQTENIIKEMETSTKDHKKTTTPFSHHEELDMFHTTELVKEISTEQSILAEKLTTPYLLYTENQNDVSKLTPVASDKETTTAIPIVTTVVYDKQETPKYEELTTSVSDREKENRITTNAPYESGNAIHETTPSEKEFIPAVTKSTTIKITEDVTISPTHFDKFTKPDEKLVETAPLSTSPPELQKPGGNEVLPTDDIPSIDEDNHFPPTGTSGYGQEPDYVEEDQAFGPGTCRYGGKVYVSAQQIPRDDPCDFCFCFRSDIICLQQSCPPPIHGCHEEPIQGFCCPRYECPVSMATTLNITTTTTTTTTTLPPHFLPHAYKGAAQRRGCQIKGHTYKVGEVVRASSGPCLHCTCGGDGQMKCDPKACTPEPMLRQMIAAAVSAKRRR